jgi:hypothetical protein
VRRSELETSVTVLQLLSRRSDKVGQTEAWGW